MKMQTKKYNLQPFFMALSFLVAILFFSGCGKIEELNKPILKSLNGDKFGKEVEISGVGYPKAKILIFINEEYIDDVTIGYGGSFNKLILFDSEGEKTISVKQAYKNVESNFSDELNFVVDLTPPSKDTFVLETEIPERTKEKNIEISGETEPDTIVLLNSNKTKANSNGAFTHTYELSEGKNELRFSLIDNVGNKTEEIENAVIIVDTIQPEIKTSKIGCLGREDSDMSESEELVCVNSGNWGGYLPNVSIPIEGYIRGDVKSILIDGKNVSWDENNEIYVRINFHIKDGLNKFKVVVEDMSGNKSSKYLEINAEDVSSEKNINLNVN